MYVYNNLYAYIYIYTYMYVYVYNLRKLYPFYGLFGKEQEKR